MGDEKKAVVKTANQKISESTGFTVQEVAIIKSTVARNTTDLELAYFLSIAKETGLSPFNKEIWCYKDNKNNLIIFAGRDGFLKKAQESPLWNGITSMAVHENDIFDMQIQDGKVVIKHTPDFKNPGKIIGAYAIVKPKNCEFPTVEWADFKTYNKGMFTWKTHPGEMIKKVAEIHALKKAYGITVLQSEHDFKIENETVKTLEPEKSELDTLKEKIIIALDNYQGTDKEEVRRTCAEKSAANEFDIDFAKKTLKLLGAL